MSNKLGLALGSGGSRGVAHVGFLKALEEAGIRPDYISGCSMGSVVGCCYASGMSADFIRDEVLKLKTWDIVDISPNVISKMAILRSKKIEDLLVAYLGDKKIEDLEIPFRCVATELYSGKLHVFEKGNAAVAVQASSSVPGVFRPVKVDNMMFVDGGCLCRVPVKVVKEMGADVVVAVDVLKNASQPVEKVGNILEMALRVFDIMDTNQTLMSRALEKGLCDVLVEPLITGMSQYLVKGLDKAYEEGYEEGKAHIDEIKKLLK